MQTCLTWVLALGALAGSGLLWPAATQDAPPLVIAEVAPLTGIYSTVGTRLSRPAKMWADDVNRRGGIRGRKLRLLTCNDESKPEKSVACARDALREGAVI